MAFASAVLMFAGSPQTFLGAASAQDSLFLFVDVVSVYGRQFSNRPIFEPTDKFTDAKHIGVSTLRRQGVPA